jgi:ABC-2 type transport system permease protein
VQVIADGSDSNSAVVGLGYASRIITQAGAEIVGACPPRAVALRPGRSELVTRVWYNPDLKSRWFYVPAVLAMVLLLVTMILPSMAVVREKEIGTLEQIIVTPLQPWQLMIGKLIPFVVIGLLDTLLIVGLSRLVFGVPLRGSLLLLTFLTLLYLLNTLGLGLLVSTMVSNQQQAMMFSAFLLMVPMIYLSGLVFPIANMPAVFQYASFAIPVRYYGNVLRGVFLRGSGLAVLWPEAVTLATMGGLLLMLASLRFRKSLD